jgi:hypothetical protein
MRPEHLAYFKDLFEGRAEVSWHAWFKKNDSQLAQELPRADYLRIKFDKLDEAEKLLHQAGIPFRMSPIAKREKFYSLLHESVLDERGRPIESFRRDAYLGAVGQFLDGDFSSAKASLTACLKKIKRRPVAKRIEDLEDMCFDAEMEFQHGNRELGRFMLEVIALLEAGNDLLDPSVFRAHELLGRDSS